MKENTTERARIYAAMFADATSAIARLREGSRTREDAAVALLPFKAMRREGATIEGHGLISFWGMQKEIDGAQMPRARWVLNFGPHGNAFAVHTGNEHGVEIYKTAEDAEDRYFEAWESFAARRDIPSDVAELMRYAGFLAEYALSGCEHAKEANAGRGIYRDFTPGNYNDVVDGLEIEMLKLSGSRGDCAHGKRVSKYLGRENITGDGDYLGWALSVPNGREIVFHKSGNTRRNAVVYTYVPAAVQIIDALIDAFQDSKRNGWINPRDPDLRLIKPGEKWQNKFSRSTFKKAIESEGTTGRYTGRVRLRPHGATKAKR